MAMYKYSCRKCPIRNRCIKESKYTTSVKNMIRSAFEVRTDTLATWGLLQANCLLIKAEEEQEQKAREESTLRRRLREAREARKEAADEARKKSGSTSPIRRLPQARKSTQEAGESRSERSAQSPDYLQPVSPSTSSLTNNQRPDVIGSSSLEEKELRPDTNSLTRKSAKPCWFTLKGTGRHIRLPQDGELVLGRFDATFGIPPDIDLAFEDGENRTVSRRHAKITASNGYHIIEDTGSSFGLLINGDKINPGQRHQLNPGDRIAMGGVQMFYDEIPEYLAGFSKSNSIRHHTLAVTPTGRKIRINPSQDVVIGRSDQYVDFTPDIDLGQDGQVAARVSRRHAIIHWRKNEPYLEDLGSGFGTRVNGRIMLLGQAVPLKPGDHIWLGGCVLAYDVEI